MDERFSFGQFVWLTLLAMVILVGMLQSITWLAERVHVFYVRCM